ncbi:hypothetical protein T484DRAFT_1789769, partial [Baffinella frigidus]
VLIIDLGAATHHLQFAPLLHGAPHASPATPEAGPSKKNEAGPWKPEAKPGPSKHSEAGPSARPEAGPWAKAPGREAGLSPPPPPTPSSPGEMAESAREAV